METNIKKALQKLSSFSVLLIFTFSLLSYGQKNVNAKISEKNSVEERQIPAMITKKTTPEELQKIKKQNIDLEQYDEICMDVVEDKLISGKI